MLPSRNTLKPKPYKTDLTARIFPHSAFENIFASHLKHFSKAFHCYDVLCRMVSQFVALHRLFSCGAMLCCVTRVVSNQVIPLLFLLLCHGHLFHDSPLHPVEVSCPVLYCVLSSFCIGHRCYDHRIYQSFATKLCRTSINTALVTRSWRILTNSRKLCSKSSSHQNNFDLFPNETYFSLKIIS